MTYSRVNLVVAVAAIALSLPIGVCASDVSEASKEKIKKLQAEGDVLAGRQQWRQALASYKQWLAAEPGSGLGTAKLAYVESHLHMPSWTAQFKRAVELSPADADVWALWAQAKKDDGDIKGEIECRTLELEKLPHTEALSQARSECFLSRCDAYMRAHQNDLAYQDLDAAIKVAPRYFRAWLQRSISRTLFRNDFQGALSDVNQAIALNPHNAELLHHRGNIYSIFAHKDLALKDLQAASDMAPNNLDIRTCLEDLKLTCQTNADPEAALKYCNQELVAKPDYPALYFRRANAHMHLKEFNKAAADVTKAISLAPDEADRVHDFAGQIAPHDLDLALKLTNDAIAARPQSVPLLITRAEIFRNSKHFFQAQKDYDAAVKEAPNDPASWFSRSFLFCDQARFDKALNDVNHAITLRPREPGFLIHRANILLLSGDKQACVAAYKRAWDAQPGNSDFHIRYVKSKLDFFKQGDVNELNKLLTEAIRNSPKNAVYSYWHAELLEQQHDYRGAAVDIARGFESDNATFDDFKGHLETLIANRQTALAIQTVSNEIKMHPRLSHLYQLRAELNVKSKSFDDAKQDIQTALQLDAKNADAIRLRGNLKDEQLDYDGAVSDYTECLNINPDDCYARLQRAVIYKESGRARAAQSDFQHLKEHCPALHAEVNLDLAYCDYALHSYAAAEQQYRQCITDGDPTIRSRALFELAKMFQQQKRYKDAIELFLQINKEQPNTSMFERCARCYMELKDWPKAVANMTMAIKGEPRDGGFYGERAEAYMQMHDYKHAIADYTEAIQYGHVQTAKFMRLRADAYEKNGQKDLADKDRQKASSMIRDLMNYH